MDVGEELLTLPINICMKIISPMKLALTIKLGDILMVFHVVLKSNVKLAVMEVVVQFLMNI